MIDLESKRERIAYFGKELFDKIGSLVGSANKKRTGIQIVVLEPNTKNIIVVSVGEPSDAAKFFAVEKAVRSNLYGDPTSQNSENKDMFQFPGSITFKNKNFHVQVSVSGLMSDEDVVVAIVILSEVLEIKISEITDLIHENNGELPDCFYNKEHCLYSVVH